MSIPARAAVGNFVDRAIESQPPGLIGPRLVEACGAMALAHSVVTKNTNALKAFALGVAGGTIGNNLNSWVGHRQGAHGSIKAKPGVVNETIRAATGVFGGIRMRSVAMHRMHHAHTDTAEDPHAPSVIGRGKVFKGIVGISDRFSEEHATYTAKVLDESMYTNERPYEKTSVFVASLLASHMVAGKKMDMPVPYRFASAALHLSMIYANSAMFTADAHTDDSSTGATINTFPYGPVMNAMFGSENGHEQHHQDPSNPRHSNFDLVYAATTTMRRFGMVEIPYLDNQDL